jgi:ADP-ribosylglycohydrolase
MKSMEERLARALHCLDGLSVGDAFGQQFFSPHQIVTRLRIEDDAIPDPPWFHTDDTEMAICLVQVLSRHGRIDQDDLAQTFARRYMNDPERGYGSGARKLLVEIYSGASWRAASAKLFGGGSLGNGAAMRVAPLGAFFADDIPTLIEQAHLSAQVSHYHPEGSAGAIAVALAAAFASNHRGQKKAPALLREFFEFIAELTPPSQTLDAINRAMELPRSSEIEEAIALLGNGSNITCPDTVPLCLWLSARHWGDYRQAIWTTATAAGDIDTNCAIVGGIVAMSCADEIPRAWLAARGALTV